MTTEYKSMTAKVIAERGNPEQAKPMEAAEHIVEDLRKISEKAENVFWVIQAEITGAGYSSPDAQLEALAKLGEYQIAMKKLREARLAFNTVRCFT